MKNIKFIFSILFIALLAGCSDDNGEDPGFAENAAAPANITALFTITQDNSGLVTIAPHAEGVTSYEIYYGDGTTDPGIAGVGEKLTHVYAEGQYSVKVVAIGINGKTTEASLPLTVTFVEPQNLVVTVSPVVGNPYQINVTATADFETYFEVTYGEDPSATPDQFNEGQTATHTYSTIGTYTVTVTAYSGGQATAQDTKTVTITNPLLLPINFENSTLNYAFTDFNGAVSAVVDNPHAEGINTSSKVGQMTPAAGATWTGGYLTLDNPVDLSTNKFFRVKVWSPAAGITVKLKLENLTDGNTAFEVDAISTVANGWEELVYDFSGASTTAEYSKVIFFFNAGQPGTGDTYYFDDIVQSNVGVPLGFPLTFESASLNYEWGTFENGAVSLINNPHQDGINTSAKVMSFSKGANLWGGAYLSLTDPVDFNTNAVIKMKVWSPAAGVPVIVKFEQLTNANVNVERNGVTTVANQWEEMTFDFTGTVTANNYQKLVVFLNAGVAGTGDTYYFDDIIQTN
jgi:hypothetical protein